MIPDYQKLMLPLHKLIKAMNKFIQSKMLLKRLAKEFKLSDNDLNDWLPSKSQKTFYNRKYQEEANLSAILLHPQKITVEEM